MLESTRPIRQIRVLLMNMPQLLLDMIRALIVSFEDIRVISGAVIQSDIFAAAATAKADVVIIADKNALTEDCMRVLYRLPKLKILMISQDGRRGLLHELRPRLATIEEISVESLIRAIHGETEMALQ
jgi:hypothetical protein